MKKLLANILLFLILVTSLFTINYLLFTTPVLAQQNPVGIINPPGLPKADNPNEFVSSLVRTIIMIFLIAAFIIAFISLILAGIQFITSGGDPKNISAAQSKILWGLIGLVVVLSSFGIIMLVEKVFNVHILSEGLSLPRI